MSTTAQPSAPTGGAPSAQTLVLGDLAHEIASTRRTLERVPADRFDWKPHPKSFSIGHLAAHLANLPNWATMTVRTEGLDFAQPIRQDVPTSRDDVLAAFDRNVAAMQAALASATDADLARPWTARRGEQVVFAMPRLTVLRSMVLNHMIHHRGQLTVYLRLLDQPVPSLYGPTADEAGGF